MLSAHRNLRRPLRALHAALLLLLSASVFQVSTGTAGSREAQAQAQAGRQQVDHLLSIAEQQFEIVKLLIKQERFDRVLPEMRKIFELDLPERFEEHIAQSAVLVADRLVESRQYGLAHEVLDEAYARMTGDRNRVSLLKMKAYVYKSEEKYDEAVATFERAVEMEKRLIRP